MRKKSYKIRVIVGNDIKNWSSSKKHVDCDLTFSGDIPKEHVQQLIKSLSTELKLLSEGGEFESAYENFYCWEE